MNKGVRQDHCESCAHVYGSKRANEVSCDCTSDPNDRKRRAVTVHKKKRRSPWDGREAVRGWANGVEPSPNSLLVRDQGSRYPHPFDCNSTVPVAGLRGLVATSKLIVRIAANPLAPTHGST